MKLYLKVTTDEYELPIAVADSAYELAEMVGTKQSVIYSSISHKRGSYRRVEVEDDETEPICTNI